MLDIRVRELTELAKCKDCDLPRPATVFEAIQATKRDIALQNDPLDQIWSFNDSMGGPTRKQISKRNVIANVFSGKNGSKGQNLTKYPVNVALEAYVERAQERLELLNLLLVRSQRRYGQEWPR
jgi:hypothetical protein